MSGQNRTKDKNKNKKKMKKKKKKKTKKKDGDDETLVSKEKHISTNRFFFNLSLVEKNMHNYGKEYRQTHISSSHHRDKIISLYIMVAHLIEEKKKNKKKDIRNIQIY